MRSRWNDLPLRLRLTMLYVGLLALILTALGSFLYFDTREFMISSTASRLQALASASISHLRLPRPFEPTQPITATTLIEPRPPLTATLTLEGPQFEFIARNLARDLTWQDHAAVVFDKDATKIANDGDLSTQSLVPAPDASTLRRALNGEQVSFLTTVSGQDILSVLVPIQFPRPESPILGVVQIATPLDVVDQVLQRQQLVIIVGILAALSLATLGGLWLTQTSLAPLQLMVDVCRRIAAGDLSQRVNLPHRRDETGQLASTFDEMVERLDDSFTTQRQFVADASHELRTPLTAISGSLEVLLLAPEGDPDTTRRVLHGMRREVQRLTRLVTDLLTLTRLDAQRKPNLQMVDLAVLGREVVETLRPLAKNRVVTIETEGNTKCRGDADQLKQVFYNLLGNAIQSTDADTGAIAVRIQGQENASRVCVAVADNGGGIPKAAQAHIFERFYRVDKARTRVSGGSGLGLAIVKAIVEGHGGTIEPVESEIGKGTTIRFKLGC
ncbi:MAG: HAMP domain-containing protein [Chloroflexi bacterium]|nr:HAMP domain-containing protein [Chloroflexota bacterium]